MKTLTPHKHFITELLQVVAVTLVLAIPKVSAAQDSSRYLNYLATSDDSYTCGALRPWVREGSFDSLTFVSPEGLAVCRRVLELRASGKALTDDHNAVIVSKQKQAQVDTYNPSTLFAPNAMTYDPDNGNQVFVGWPLRNSAVQKRGFDAVNSGEPSCVVYSAEGNRRQSPYGSHCSAYVAWVAREVFGVSLMPTRIGDWCHVAAEQRNRMLADTAHWSKVNAVTAQEAANMGRLVIAARQTGRAALEPLQNNGHIAIVLPHVVASAEALQSRANYPTSPAVRDRASFVAFLSLYGPEISQAGGLNFSHTVTANGFARYYPATGVPGVTPIDEVVEFFVYLHETKIRPL